MRRFLLLNLLFCILLPIEAQIDEHIQQIRKRFYHINGDAVQLRSDKIGAGTYFFEGDELRKVMLKEGDVLTEYYFDRDYRQDYAYFIYQIIGTGDSKQEHRFYYGDDGELIRWLGPGLTEIFRPDERFCQKERSMRALSKDLLIRLENGIWEKGRPEQSRWVREIHTYTSELDKMALRADTLEDIWVPDEQYFEKKVEYFDPLGNRVRVFEISGGDHGAYETIEYFNLKGELVLHTSIRSAIYEDDVQTNSYYRNGANSPFRLVEFVTEESSYMEEDPCQGFRHVYVGKIIE